jgi:hypothetical protein
MNKYMPILAINCLHGFLYKNPTLRRINASASLLMMFAIQLIKADKCILFLIVFGLGIFLMFFFDIKKIKKRSK